MTIPVALVTGGNRSIGLQVAKDLYAKGYSVFIACRDANKAKEALTEIAKVAEGKTIEGQKLSFITLDLSDANTIPAAVTAFKSESDRLDVLVNNAAIYSEDRNATLETNYFNTIAVTEAFLPLLKQSAATAPTSKKARIVIVSSRMGCFDWAKITGDALAALTDHSDLDKITALAKAWGTGDDSTGLSTVAYSTSKALINAYGRNLADRFAKEQTPVEVILTCPGTTKTDMNPNGTKTVEQGADTISWACYDASVNSGKFYGHRTEVPFDTCDISLMGKV